MAPSFPLSSRTANIEGLPPQSREAEVAVLGSMLVEKESLLKALDVLREDDFYEENHRRIFSAIRALHDRNITCDVITVGDELEKGGRLAGLGGRAALFELTNLVPSALHVEHYARIVREKSLFRQMIAIARTVADESLSRQKKPTHYSTVPNSGFSFYPRIGRPGGWSRPVC